jgi:hypothetical protein
MRGDRMGVVKAGSGRVRAVDIVNSTGLPEGFSA